MRAGRQPEHIDRAGARIARGDRAPYAINLLFRRPCRCSGRATAINPSSPSPGDDVSTLGIKHALFCGILNPLLYLRQHILELLDSDGFSEVSGLIDVVTEHIGNVISE